MSLTPQDDSFLPHPKHCSPSQWKILTLQSSIKGWRACTLKMPVLSFNKNRPRWKKAGPRCVHRLDIWEIVITPALMKSALTLITGCSWVKYVQIPDIQVICYRNHSAEGSKGHCKRNLEHQWGGPGTFNPAQSPEKVSQQDHGTHEDVEELLDPSLLTLLVITKGAANFCQSILWVKYGKQSKGWQTVTCVGWTSPGKVREDKHRAAQTSSSSWKADPWSPSLKKGRYRDTGCVTPPAWRASQRVLNILASLPSPWFCCSDHPSRYPLRPNPAYGSCQGLLQVNSMDKAALVWAPTALCSPQHSPGRLRQNFILSARACEVQPQFHEMRPFCWCTVTHPSCFFGLCNEGTPQNDNQHARDFPWALGGWELTAMAVEAAASCKHGLQLHTTPGDQSMSTRQGPWCSTVSQKNLLLLQVCVRQPAWQRVSFVPTALPFLLSRQKSI